MLPQSPGLYRKSNININVTIVAMIMCALEEHSLEVPTLEANKLTSTRRKSLLIAIKIFSDSSWSFAGVTILRTLVCHPDTSTTIITHSWDFLRRSQKLVADKADDRTLLIFAYSGYAEATRTTFETECIGKDHGARPCILRVLWDSLRDTANTSPSDILFISSLLQFGCSICPEVPAQAKKEAILVRPYY